MCVEEKILENQSEFSCLIIDQRMRRIPQSDRRFTGVEERDLQKPISKNLGGTSAIFNPQCIRYMQSAIHRVRKTNYRRTFQKSWMVHPQYAIHKLWKRFCGKGNVKAVSRKIEMHTRNLQLRKGICGKVIAER